MVEVDLLFKLAGLGIAVAVLSQVLSRAEDSGRLADLDLKYRRSYSGLSLRVAFVDLSWERSMISRQVLTSLAVFVLAMAGIVIISLNGEDGGVHLNGVGILRAVGGARFVEAVEGAAQWNGHFLGARVGRMLGRAGKPGGSSARR